MSGTLRDGAGAATASSSPTASSSHGNMQRQPSGEYDVGAAPLMTPGTEHYHTPAEQLEMYELEGYDSVPEGTIAIPARDRSIRPDGPAFVGGERTKPTRSASTSFAPLPQGKVGNKAPDAAMEEGWYAGAKEDGHGHLVRVFSKREQEKDGEGSHPFGGDLSRRETANALERFKSQAGKDEVIVHWEGENDPENPQNWSPWYRWYVTALTGLLVLNSTFTSSAPSGIIPQLEQDLQMSSEIATLTIAIFVAGYLVGPLAFGPASERLGRKPTFLFATLFYTGFNVGCALAPNTGALLAFRFLGGVFASSPLTVAGAVQGDIHGAKQRGLALSLFSLAPFAGPSLGPIVSGAIQVTGTSWRILFWVCTAFSGALGIVTLLTLRETYAPIILVRKAKRIRKETGNDKYVAPLELHPLKPKELAKSVLLKPFVMLFQEPMLLVLTLYLSFVYGLVYLLFEAFPFVFQGIYGFNELQSGLCFLPLTVGGAVAVALYALFENPRYVRMVDEAKDGRVAPEQRLTIVMIAGPLLCISFFWFGWTSYPSINYWAPLMSVFTLGIAILLIFLGLFNYIVDAYLANAASALSANTVCRSAFGAGFPMFAAQMYQRLNQHWASTLLGCLAALLAPAPFVLFKYGPKIRAMSKHAASH